MNEANKKRLREGVRMACRHGLPYLRRACREVKGIPADFAGQLSSALGTLDEIERGVDIFSADRAELVSLDVIAAIFTARTAALGFGNPGLCRLLDELGWKLALASALELLESIRDELPEVEGLIGLIGQAVSLPTPPAPALLIAGVQSAATLISAQYAGSYERLLVDMLRRFPGP